MPKTTKPQSPSVEVPLRIIVVHPPAGVEFRLQQGRSNLVAPTRVTPTEIQFDFNLRLGPTRGDRPNLLGDAAQGPPANRFVYVNSGRQAGQQETCWDRRAKVPLQGITSALLKALLAANDAVLEARIEGTARDGGPVCATVSLLGETWRLVAKRSSLTSA